MITFLEFLNEAAKKGTLYYANRGGSLQVFKIDGLDGRNATAIKNGTKQHRQESEIYDICRQFWKKSPKSVKYGGYALENHDTKEDVLNWIKEQCGGMPSEFILTTYYMSGDPYKESAKGFSGTHYLFSGKPNPAKDDYGKLWYVM